MHKILKRKTFAIISHPDAGKTTITEKFLLFGKVIKIAGTVKSRRSHQYVKSDWMKIEKQRGISITTSVMQFSYRNNLINLLDTPGHQDFSEDTYRTLTAVDSCLMVIDAAKGVESCTRKLLSVTRLRNTPILTFMNKLDRDTYNPIEVMDNVEHELKIFCAPITWPISCGKYFKGIYHINKNETYLYEKGKGHTIQAVRIIKDLNNPELDVIIGKDLAFSLREELELIQGASYKFNKQSFLMGKLTPVFFGTALGNFGIDHVLNSLINWAPTPMPRITTTRIVEATEKKFTGFIFKIQANMNSKHHDRIAFMRVVSGKYYKGIKLYQVRNGKNIIISNALIFMAGDRSQTQVAYPGDIIGLYNHGTIKIGDTFTEGEKIKFTGIPNFAPELFCRIQLKNPLKQKQLLKGLIQLSEEGAIQVFRPISNNHLLIGAMGSLQFDIVVARLKNEYNIEALYKSADIFTIRWISCNDIKKFEIFKQKNILNLALDSENNISYVASTAINLKIIKKRYPEIIFKKTREF
ncbi:Peptide chain release factor RF3 [Candidatus Ecksteinia adelgidicola]|nr:Peptide chain release factor RF3 [Candidatus Ecksteinia adelgidicola]